MAVDMSLQFITRTVDGDALGLFDEFDEFGVE